MSIIPCVRSMDIRRSIDFYTHVLGFKMVRGWAPADDPAVTMLSGHGGKILLSSHCGDGQTGQPVMVSVGKADLLFRKFIANGYQVPDTGGRSEVHEGPTDQSWGTREFYVDDPDGNTLRFVGS